MAYNEKRGLLVTSSADQSFGMLRINGKGLDRVWTATNKNDTPTAVEWMGDNRFLSGFVRRDQVGVFETERGNPVYEYAYERRGDCGQVNCLKMSHRLKMIASGHEDHCVRFFDPNSSILPLIQINGSSKWQPIQTESQDCSSGLKALNC